MLNKCPISPERSEIWAWLEASPPPLWRDGWGSELKVKLLMGSLLYFFERVPAFFCLISRNDEFTMRFSTVLPVVFAGLAMAWDERAGDIFSKKSGVKTSGNSSGVFVDVGGGTFRLFLFLFFSVVFGDGGVGGVVTERLEGGARYEK